MTMEVAMPPNITSIAGPMFIGCVLNWGLYGVLSVQVYMYYLSFPNDRWIPKALVYTLYLIETAQVIIVTNDSFDTYARGFGNLDSLASVKLEWLAVPVLCGIVSCAVQLYYAYRLLLLSGSRLLASTISVIAIVQGIAGVVSGARACILKSFTVLASDKFMTSAVTVWSAGSAMVDVIIALAMTIVLSRKDTGLPNTHEIVSKIIRMVVETGCLTGKVCFAVLEERKPPCFLLIMTFYKTKHWSRSSISSSSYH